MIIVCHCRDMGDDFECYESRGTLLVQDVLVPRGPSSVAQKQIMICFCTTEEVHFRTKTSCTKEQCTM